MESRGERVRRERTFGAVIYRAGRTGREYLLLHNIQGHWDFTKGHAEPGETPEQTIRREVREEAGIVRIRFVPGFVRRLRWKFRRRGVLIRKAAMFRLARAGQFRISLSREHDLGRWLSAASVRALIRFDNVRALLQAADNFLARRRAR